MLIFENSCEPRFEAFRPAVVAVVVVVTNDERVGQLVEQALHRNILLQSIFNEAGI